MCAFICKITHFESQEVSDYYLGMNSHLISIKDDFLQPIMGDQNV